MTLTSPQLYLCFTPTDILIQIGLLMLTIDAPFWVCSSYSLVLPLLGGPALSLLLSASSTEAEFIAASNATLLALYIWSIPDDLFISQSHATIIYED